uniref:Metallo-beta-lactamase family protein, putative n=1 Tax=uncultured marine bacterium 578 TaxID=257399 RepID=Q6SFR2_9BACT|nr:metallo-beta-lactamase family protein, putative [uncultured marine bacterium 578]
MTSRLNVSNIADGISVIDSGYFSKDFAAIYLLRQGNEVAIIETGNKYSATNVQKALKMDGLSFSDVAYIIPTHVHLDHAGGAGELMNRCQNAQLIVHPRGARHMINPSKLIEGAMAVYGEENFNKLYGEIIPIDSSRVIEADDKFILDFEGRELKFIDTPGHARHHFCVWDKQTESMFTGDTFGVSYRDLDKENEVYIFPSTSPVQFDPEALIKSIYKIMEYKPQRVCLTHFAAIKPTQKVVNQLIDGIHFVSNLAKKYATENDAELIIQDEMINYFLKGIKKVGNDDLEFCRDRLKLDVEINTQGLIYWQQKISSN